MVTISSWGRLEQPEHELRPLQHRSSLASTLRDGAPGLPFGMGRSYGDVCLNPEGTLWTTRSLDNFIRFDQANGIIECEAGVLLKDIQELIVPLGWMLPVTPGTQFVTVGGAIANDVHGKNHHEYGSFGNHVERLLLCRTDGEEIECGPGMHDDWYAATVGGMGLTGVISRATISLRRIETPWMTVESIPFYSLEEFYKLADRSESDWEYTVSWIDCVAKNDRRGIFFRANHSLAIPTQDYSTSRRNLVFTPPISLVNRLSLKPFNWAYFHSHRLRSGEKEMHYQPFFYPLDQIQNWNRMYGPRGFYQYQCVIPTENREAAIAALLDETTNSNSGSFLAVLKTFGEKPSSGLLSFPQAGATLALDFPNRGKATLDLMQRLDVIVGQAGGRLYAAKDARMTAGLYAAGYPNLDQFQPFRDPGISSALSRRLLGS
ncbi:MAG: FAD-binding oxidoreductase [Halieaceae bacterium]